MGFSLVTQMDPARAERLAGIARIESKNIFEASAVLPKSAVDTEQRTVRGIVGSAAVDIEGDVVDPLGGDFSYFPSQVNSVYWQHDYNALPIGKCRRLRTTKSGDLESVTTIAKSGFGDDLLTAIDQGIVSGLSLGFIPTDMGPPTPEEAKKWPKCKRVIRKWTALEYSITPMPCNPRALIESVTKARIRFDSALKFGLDRAEFEKSVSTPRPRKVFVLDSGLVLMRRSV